MGLTTNLIDAYANLSGGIRGLISVAFAILVYLLFRWLISSLNKFAKEEPKKQRGNWKERLMKQQGV